MLGYSRIHSDALRNRYECYRHSSDYAIPSNKNYYETRPYYSKKFYESPYNNTENTLQRSNTILHTTNDKRPESELRYKPLYSRRNMYNKYASPQKFSMEPPYQDKHFLVDRKKEGLEEWDELRNKSYFAKPLHETDDRLSRLRHGRSLRPPTPDLQHQQQQQYESEEQNELNQECKTKSKEPMEKQKMEWESPSSKRKHRASNNTVHPHSLKNRSSNKHKSATQINGTQKSNSSFSSSTSSNVSETNKAHVLDKTEVSQLSEEQETSTSMTSSSSSSTTSTTSTTSLSLSSSSYSSTSSSSTSSSSSSSTSSSESTLLEQQPLTFHKNNVSSGDNSKLEKLKELANGTQHLVTQKDREGVISDGRNEPYLATIAESLLRKEVQLKKLELMLSSEKQLFAHQLRQRTLSKEELLLPMEKNMEQYKFIENTELEKTRLHEFVENLISSSENMHEQQNVLQNKTNEAEEVNKRVESNNNECACEDDGNEPPTPPSTLLDSHHSSLLLLPPPPSYEHAIHLRRLNLPPQHRINLIRATVRMPSSTEVQKSVNEWSTQTPISASMLDEQIQTDLSAYEDSNHNGAMLSPRDDVSDEHHHNVYRLQDSTENDKYENSTSEKFRKGYDNRKQHAILVHVANQEEEDLTRNWKNDGDGNNNGDNIDDDEYERSHKKKKIKVKIRKPHLTENNVNKEETSYRANRGLNNAALQTNEETWAAGNTSSGTNMNQENYNPSRFKHDQSLPHNKTDNVMHSTMVQYYEKEPEAAAATNPNLASLNSPFTSGNDGSCANENNSQQVIMLAPLPHYKHLTSVNCNEPIITNEMNSSREEVAMRSAVDTNDGNIVYMLQEPYKSSTENDNKVRKKLLMPPDDSNSVTNRKKNDSKSKEKSSKSKSTISTKNSTTNGYRRKELSSSNTKHTKSASAPLEDFELLKSKTEETLLSYDNTSKAQSDNKLLVSSQLSNYSNNPQELLSSSIYIEKEQNKTVNVEPLQSSLSSQSKAVPVLTSEEIQKSNKDETVVKSTNSQSHVASSHEPIESAIPNVVTVASVHGKQSPQSHINQSTTCEEESQEPNMENEAMPIREKARAKPIVDSVEHSHALSANSLSPLVVSFPSPPLQPALEPTPASAPIAATTTTATTQDQQEQQQYHDVNTNNDRDPQRYDPHAHRRRSNQAQDKAICGNCCKG